MKTKIAFIILLGMLGTACRFIPKLDFIPEYAAPEVEVEPASTPLENAQRATFVMALPEYRTIGSAVIIGRKGRTFIDEHGDLVMRSDAYEYRVATAYHVVDRLIRAGKGASKIIMAMFQPSLHSQPLRMKLQLEKMECYSTTHDWAIFTFYSKHRLPFVEIATKQEFEAIQPFESIYAVGGDGGFGQLCRRGTLGSTHSQYINAKSQAIKATHPWQKYPDVFFRPLIPVWYGASGGGVFNQQGKLIGLVNGGHMVALHIVYCIKAHIILRSLDETK